MIVETKGRKREDVTRGQRHERHEKHQHETSRVLVCLNNKEKALIASVCKQ